MSDKQAQKIAQIFAQFLADAKSAKPVEVSKLQKVATITIIGGWRGSKFAINRLPNDPRG